MKIVLVSVATAIAAAAATMAHANVPLRIDEHKVSEEARLAADELLKTNSMKALMGQDFGALSNVLSVNGNTSLFDVKNLLAAASGTDSTYGIDKIDPFNAYGCYSNCYSNCHGSRSWR